MNIEVIQAIKQAQANASDFRDPNKTDGALRREVGHPWKEYRVNDGFSVSFLDNKVKITYSVQLRDHVTGKENFLDTDLKNTLKDIENYLKKEYKKITGKTLTLKKVGEEELYKEFISMTRTIFHLSAIYEIGGEPSMAKEYNDEVDKKHKEIFDKYLGK